MRDRGDAVIVSVLAAVAAAALGYRLGRRDRARRSPPALQAHAIGHLAGDAPARCRCGHSRPEHWLRDAPGGRGCQRCGCVLFAPRLALPADAGDWRRPPACSMPSDGDRQSR